jgi:Family of unknown function (DUF6600)
MTGLTQRSPIPMTSRNRLLRTTLQGLAPALLAIVMAGSAAAQDANGPDGGPPALVGRISAITGPVSMQRSDAQDWIDAGVNEPVSIGDAVYAPEGADARIQIGATDLDLKSDTEIDIAALDDNAGTIRLDSGSLDLRVSAVPTDDGLSIATPRGTVRLTQPGIYNIDAGSETDPTRVTAWNGSARLGDSATAVTVQQGQTLVIAGTADAPQYSYSSDIGESPREWRTPPRVVTTTDRYVSAEMTGAEDLYQYGAFESAPDYGTVWYPRDVPSDWQPYRYGHWEYVAPWGQTWIDDRPWGFAPFHYGRWAYIGSRWGWVPGQYERRPVYAPALVAFVGGGGFSASISIGGGGGAIGWVPLAPGEGYRPPYRVSNTYIQNINRTTIVNKTVINNYGPGAGQRGFGPNAQPQTMAGFANRRFATVVPADVVGKARPVAAAAVQVHPEALERAQVNAEAVRAIKPVPAAERPAARPGPVARPANPRAAVNVRPALPPARAGGANRPNAQPAPAAVPAARPGQPPAPSPAMQRPNANPPAAPQAGQPANRPTPDARPVPGTRPAPVPPRDRPAMNGPNAPKPDVAKPEAPKPEAPKPEAARPQNDRPAMTRPAPAKPEARPAAEPARPPRPEAKPAPAAPRPEPRPQAAPRPQPQVAPRPEARPAPAPRPEPRPQAAPQPQQPRPQAQPPRPQPQAQPRPQPQAQPRPQPQPQAQHPAPQSHPAPAAPNKKPDDKNKNNN